MFVPRPGLSVSMRITDGPDLFHLMLALAEPEVKVQNGSNVFRDRLTLFTVTVDRRPTLFAFDIRALTRDFLTARESGFGFVADCATLEDIGSDEELKDLIGACIPDQASDVAADMRIALRNQVAALHRVTVAGWYNPAKQDLDRTRKDGCLWIPDLTEAEVAATRITP